MSTIYDREREREALRLASSGTAAQLADIRGNIGIGIWNFQREVPRWTTSIILTRDNRELCNEEGDGAETVGEREREISEVFEARTIKEEFRAEAGGQGRFPRENIWKERRGRGGEREGGVRGLYE